MVEITTDELIEKVKTLLEAEGEDATKFLTGIHDKLIPVKEESVELDDKATEISSALCRIKIGQATKLRNFQKGENFSRFCERFQEYVEITQIVDSKLHLFFLQHVDDVTYSTLKAVNLDAEQQSDCSLFCEIYKDAVYGSETVPLKNEVLECKQLVDEDITSFAHRLREKAIIAFSNEESIDENCLLSLMRGVRDNSIRQKLNESSVSNFSEALKLAKKLEKISNMFGAELNPATSILKNVSFDAVDDRRQEKENNSVSPSYRERSRSDRSDSWRPNRSPSPGRDSNRNSWSRSPSGTGNGNSARFSFRNNRGASRSRERQATSSRPETRKCWACNRVGHLKRNCYARNRAAGPSGTRPSRNLN